MTKKEAEDAYFGARLFYNGLMFFVLGVFLYYDNKLHKAIFSFDVIYVISYLSLFGISYYLYTICGHNPGFADIQVSGDPERIELSISNPDKRSGTESLLLTSSNSTPNQDLEDGTNDAVKEARERGEKFRKQKVPHNQDTTDGLFPEKRYCDICQITQPYRTKHCDKCERCVHKFDHHCFWIGGCVGELNHRKFWMFLFCQTLLEIWSYFIADSGLDASYSQGVDRVKTGDSSPYTSSEYGAFTAITIIVFLTIIFTGALLGFHTFLVLSNQTTWEYMKKDRISYLKIYPKSIYPFSQGVIENIKSIFLHQNRLKEWELPNIDSVDRQKGFNWCENEYWSCC